MFANLRAKGRVPTGAGRPLAPDARPTPDPPSPHARCRACRSTGRWSGSAKDCERQTFSTGMERRAASAGPRALFAAACTALLMLTTQPSARADPHPASSSEPSPPHAVQLFRQGEGVPRGTLPVPPSGACPATSRAAPPQPRPNPAPTTGARSGLGRTARSQGDRDTRRRRSGCAGFRSCWGSAADAGRQDRRNTSSSGNRWKCSRPQMPVC